MENEKDDSSCINARYRIGEIQFEKFGKYEVFLKINGKEFDKRVVNVTKREENE